MTSELQAREVTCVDCTTTFIIPRAERVFRAERGLAEPESCPACRQKLRSARNADLFAIYDRSFQPEPVSNRNGGSRRRQNDGGTSHQPRTRYNTVCSACGVETQVPFVPRGDRPVYCRTCYNAQKGR